MPVRLMTLADHRRVDADVGFRCRCGVEKVVRVADLVRVWSPALDPNLIASRMRCRACGKRAVFAFAVLPDGVVQPRLPFRPHWFGGAYAPEKIED